MPWSVQLVWVVLSLLGIGCPAAVPGPRPSIVLISMDTLRADRLGAWGNDRGLTPNLDRFAGESILFDQAYSQSNETLYSHASLFTGRYPSELSALDDSFAIPAEVPVLASVLGTYGYQSGAFVAGGHMSRRYGLDRGFDVYDDSADWGALVQTTTPALAWLDSLASNASFFLLVHGYDTHDRYLKPTPFGYAFGDPAGLSLGAEIARTTGAAMRVVGGALSPRVDPIMAMVQSHPRLEHGRRITSITNDVRRLSEDDVQQVVNAYDGAVAYADAGFGLLMAGLAERGVLEKSWIIVLSDHGEGLGEVGVFSHRMLLDDSSLHVPLLIRPPGGIIPQRISGIVELTDVLPTILDVADATAPAGIRGFSLLPTVRGKAKPTREVAFSEGASRLFTARGPGARVTSSGIGVSNRFNADLVAALPLGGVSVRSAGNAAEAPALRDAVVAWRRSIVVPEAVKTDVDPNVHEMQQHGYWDATP